MALSTAYLMALAAFVYQPVGPLDTLDRLAIILDGEAGGMDKYAMREVAASIATRIDSGSSLLDIEKAYYGRGESNWESRDIAFELIFGQIVPDGLPFCYSIEDAQKRGLPTDHCYTVGDLTICRSDTWR